VVGETPAEIDGTSVALAGTMRLHRIALSLSLLATAAAPAAADPEGTPTVAAKVAPSPYGFGARVGGYGFRRDADDARSNWDECRMNGLGVFGQRTLGAYAFVEAGLDLYFSESFPMQPNHGDLPIDRFSGLVSAAIGMRADGPWRTSGYAQLGAGVELTHVSVPYGDDSISDQMALPEGFLGIGGDLRVGDRTYLGANLRAHLMGNFAYDRDELAMQPGWTSPPAAAEVFDPSPDLAAQAQFYVRRDL
jgi:hypothetical protein